jgi:hypothetical protein
MAEADEPPTPEQVAALAEAMEGAVKPRKRGRPPGRLSTADAAWAGLRALEGSPLPVYGSAFGPGYSRCAAVALAMRRCGFRQFATPAAVANLARQWRRRQRCAGWKERAPPGSCWSVTPQTENGARIGIRSARPGTKA